MIMTFLNLINIDSFVFMKGNSLTYTPANDYNFTKGIGYTEECAMINCATTTTTTTTTNNNNKQQTPVTYRH